MNYEQGSVISLTEEHKEKFFIPKSVLVVSCHPDDAEINAGGLIALLIDNHSSVHYLICSNGDSGSWTTVWTKEQLSLTRRQEQTDAATLLGVSSVTFLDIPDGFVRDSDGYLKERITHALREIKPQMVVTHDPWKRYDLNDDHRATGFATGHAVLLAGNLLFHPEHAVESLEPHFTPMLIFFNTDNPNMWVDITDFYALKEAAIKKHQSQFADRQSFISDLERKAVAQGQIINKQYAEAHRLEINS